MEAGYARLVGGDTGGVGVALKVGTYKPPIRTISLCKTALLHLHGHPFTQLSQRYHGFTQRVLRRAASILLCSV